MRNRVNHFFPTNSLHVITGLLPNGQYGAYRHELDKGRIRGVGATPLEAIVDMVASIEEEAEEPDDQWWQEGGAENHQTSPSTE